MTFLVDLTDHDKLLILSACLSLSILAIILLICKVFPCCPLYKRSCCCHSYDEEEAAHPQKSANIRSQYKHIESLGNDEKYRIPFGTLEDGPIRDPPLCPATNQLPSLERMIIAENNMPKYEISSNNSSNSGTPNPTPYPLSSITKNGNKKRDSSKSNHSKQSSFSFPGTTDSGSTRGSLSEEPRSKIDFALQYDSADQKLAVYLIGCNNLPASLYGSACDCFVRILLVRDLKKGWFSRRSSLSLQDLTNPDAGFDTVEVQSNLIRRNLNPTFSECHVVRLTEKEKKISGLKIAACQIDKFGRHLLVGECHVYLAKEDLSERKAFSKQLKQNLPNLGEVSLTLNYLPTAERLCVTVEKATGLRLAETKLAYLSLNPFVKVSLINRGKVFERHKTTVLLGTDHPEYMHLMNFDLPANELDKVTIIVSVLHQAVDNKDDKSKVTQESSGSSEDRDSGTGTSGTATSGIKSRRKSAGNLQEMSHNLEVRSQATKTCRSSENVHVKSVVIGRLALGEHVTGSGRSHWKSMVTYPRTPTTSTHKLIP